MIPAPKIGGIVREVVTAPIGRGRRRGPLSPRSRSIVHCKKSQILPLKVLLSCSKILSFMANEGFKFRPRILKPSFSRGRAYIISKKSSHGIRQRISQKYFQKEAHFVPFQLLFVGRLRWRGREGGEDVQTLARQQIISSIA